MSDRIDIEFPGEDGTTLRGWLYRRQAPARGLVQRSPWSMDLPR